MVMQHKGGFGSAVGNAWALLFGIGVLMLGNGLQGSLLGVRAAQEEFGSSLTGLVMAAFFVGFLAGSTLTPLAVRRVGHVRVLAALAALASVAVLVHALLVTPLAWGLMRLVTGLCYAGIFVVAESWLNDRTANETRGQILGLYMATSFLGMGGGQLLLNLADPAGSDLFIVASALISFSVLPLLLSASPAPDFAAPRPVGLARLFEVSPLGTVGTFAAGVVNGTVFGMGAVWAAEAGFGVTEISLFMGTLIAGAALLQWPIGRLSDLFDRRAIMTATTFAAVAAALATERMSGETGWPFFALAAVMGGLSLTIHSLSIAYTNDYLAADEVVGASSGLVLVLGTGSIVGPLAVGPAISFLGPAGFFWWIALVHTALGLFALWRMTRRAALPAEDQTPFSPMPAQSGPFAEAIAAEGASESQNSAGQAGSAP